MEDEAYNILGILKQIDIFTAIDEEFRRIGQQYAYEEIADAALC